MIPKIIHYCWFGQKQKPRSVRNNIKNWKKVLPDFEIIEWNEENFDVNSIDFTREANNVGKYAFVSDYVRMYALYEYGGVYLDTDVEIVKNFDDFLQREMFMGFEGDEYVGTAVIGSKKEDSFIEQIMSYYKKQQFIQPNGLFNDTPNTHILSRILNDMGLIFNNSQQLINRTIDIYPVDYFSAKSFLTGEITKTNNTICIHHFSCSWLPYNKRLKLRISYSLKSLKRLIRKAV